jgi:hypothetical protein
MSMPPPPPPPPPNEKNHWSEKWQTRLQQDSEEGGFLTITEGQGARSFGFSQKQKEMMLFIDYYSRRGRCTLPFAVEYSSEFEPVLNSIRNELKTLAAIDEHISGFKYKDGDRYINVNDDASYEKMKEFSCRTKHHEVLCVTLIKTKQEALISWV